MTFNRVPQWQQSLDPKLVRRLNNPLMKQGVIDGRMARRIIERSPDILEKLPLLAQQMQRWSTNIHLESESTPIVYVQHQEQRSQAVEQQTINPNFASPDSSQGNKQVLIVNAKSIPVDMDLSNQDQMTPLVNQRSQSTELTLPPDNSLPNLPNNISSTPSESPIQRKAETPTNLPIVNVNSEQSSSLTENPQIPLVQQLAPTISNIEKPLVNLANNISSTPSESPIQRKTETPANLPIVNVNSEQSSSLTENPQIPLVQQLAPTISNIEKPLVNLANNISSTPSESPIQRKTETPANLPIVNVNSEQSSSLTENPQIPLVQQLAPTISNIEKPLVNLANNISSTPSESPIQRKTETPANLPIVNVNSEQSSSLTENPQITLVQQLAPTISNIEKPLVNLANNISSTPSESPIQRKTETPANLSIVNVNSEQSSSLTENPQIPLVQQLAPTISNIEKPLVNLANNISSTPSESPIQRKTETPANLPIVNVNSEQSSSLTENPQIPLVQQLAPTISNIEKPLVNLANNISSTPSESPIQRKTETPANLPIVNVNSEQSSSLTENPQIPLVQQLSPTISNIEKPLVNLANNISSTPSESPIQRKTETPANLPIVNVNSEQSSSLTENPQIPLVQQLAPTISNIEKPLVNLANNISSTPSESPANLPIVNVNSEQSSSLTENPQIPLVQQLAPTISNIEKPLVNLANNISSTPSESPIQRKTETPANLPIVNVNSEQSSSLTENPQIPLVQQLAPTISNIEKPLVNLANNISSTPSESPANLPIVNVNSEQSSSLTENPQIPLVQQLAPTISNIEKPLVNLANNISSTPSESPIQRKTETPANLPIVNVNSEQSSSLTENPQITLVQQLAPTISNIEKPLVNLANQISSTPSESPIQRKTETPANLPIVNVNSEQSSSLTENPQIPLVQQLAPTISNIEKPLVNLANNISSTPSESPIQRKTETPANLPIVNVNSEQSSSLTENPQIPLVQQLAPTISNIEKPLVNLANQISSTPSESPIQRKTETPANLPIVNVNSEQSSSLTENPQIPLVQQLAPTISNIEKPLVNLANNISSTPSESPIQRKTETPANLPIVNVNSEQSSSLTENPQIPLVQQLAPTISNIEKPLVNLANNISSTPSESPIQRKTETPANLPIVNVNSEQSSSLTENPQIPLVQQLAPTISNIEKPLVNLANNISSTPSESPIQRKTETPANLPIVNVNSEQSSSLTENPQIPLVQQLAPTISNIEKPLVNLANNISSTSEGISTNTNNRSSPSTSVIPIIDGSISKIKPKLENSVVVYSQPISPKLAANEPMLLIEEFKRNNPLVVTNGNKRVEKITQSTVANAQSKLPVVKINSEPSLPEFESLVLSTSPSAKKKASTLNSSQLTSQMNLGTTTNYNVTSSPAETSITNNIASNQGIMASTPSINSQLLKVNQINQTSIAGVSRPPQIDVDDLADKVERKIMRRLVVESERRGKNKWR